MPVTLQQTDTAADSGTSAGCSGETLNAEAAAREASAGGTSGTTELMFDVTNGSTEAVLMFQSDATSNEPDTGTWDSGDYVVRMNVTTTQNDLTWVATYICERTSGGSFSTVASLTGQTTDITTAGVHSQTVNRATDYTPAGTDSTLYVVCVVQNAHNHTTRTVGVTPDQQIDTPIVVDTGGTTASESVTSLGSAGDVVGERWTASGGGSEAVRALDAADASVGRQTATLDTAGARDVVEAKLTGTESAVETARAPDGADGSLFGREARTDVVAPGDAVTTTVQTPGGGQAGFGAGGQVKVKRNWPEQVWQASTGGGA